MFIALRSLLANMERVIQFKLYNTAPTPQRDPLRHCQYNELLSAVVPVHLAKLTLHAVSGPKILSVGHADGTDTNLALLLILLAHACSDCELLCLLAT